MNTANSIGGQLRMWRQRRRLSQLELACDADISARHVSFLETGRSQPSREMLLRLAERLAIPLRERNPLLLSAGFAPVYAERKLDDPALQQARKAMELVPPDMSRTPLLRSTGIGRSSPRTLPWLRYWSELRRDFWSRR
jgi:transcriptional regulator with XRE-family HTH domain